jgi:hypothetical protein
MPGLVDFDDAAGMVIPECVLPRRERGMPAQPR